MHRPADLVRIVIAPHHSRGHVRRILTIPCAREDDARPFALVLLRRNRTQLSYVLEPPVCPEMPLVAIHAGRACRALPTTYSSAHPWAGRWCERAAAQTYSGYTRSHSLVPAIAVSTSPSHGMMFPPRMAPSNVPAAKTHSIPAYSPTRFARARTHRSTNTHACGCLQHLQQRANTAASP